MDPPPLPPLPATAAATTAATQLGYSDSLDSSPRSRNADSSWDAEPLPQVPGAKLRLMCSYGGHILPRPHDKSLCYVGGETRIVVADRHSSLSDLCSRLSRTLLNGRPFSLKYQLPTEELDSLISVTTDEDLDNMVEEYDRTSSSASPLKPSSRLRLFLFFGKPETAASMGALLDDAKSESWFVDALNGSGLMPRNLSDSAAAMDCLLTGGSDSCNDLEAAASQGDFFGDHNSGKPSVVVQEVHSISESAFVESNTSSSSGSSSSSPCLSNLPPIRVRMDGNVAGVVQGQKPAGIEEQFAQISFAAAPTMVAAAGSGALSTNPMAVNSGGGETMNRINSEDDISGQNVPVGFRKPPLPMPLQPQHFKQGGGGGGYSLPSPDSVASDSSIASANSLSKPMYYQEQVQVAARDGRAPVSPNTTSDASDQGSRNQVQQVQDSGYGMPPQSDQQQQNQLQQQQQQQQQLLQQQQQQQQQQLQQQHLQQQQQQQQQFVHASAQYMNIQHPATGQVPVSPYYTMYAPPSQQQQLHHQIDHQQQYPVYLMPVAQSQQPYKMALQSTIADPAGVASTTRITSQNPAAYKDSIPPIYPPKTASPAMPEMTQSVYQTSVTPTPQLVQIPSNHYQQQFVGYSQMHHPSQSIAVPSSATAPNYAYEYANPSHEQVYYTQHQAAPLPSQYQSMTPAAAAAAVAMSDESKQVAAYSAADQSHTQS